MTAELIETMNERPTKIRMFLAIILPKLREMQ